MAAVLVVGRSDFLTPEAIASRMSSKRLQKRRHYCQKCQEQCRDQRGFKWHCAYPSAQGQLLLAAENPRHVMVYFLEEFRKDFLELLRRRFGRVHRRVHSNVVYNE